MSTPGRLGGSAAKTGEELVVGHAYDVMAKAPPVSYGGLSLKAKTAEKPAEVAAAAEPAVYDDGPRRPRPMESKADPTLIYMSPDAKMALKQYALTRRLKVKVHDLLIEAMEEWGEKRGIDKNIWRAPSTRPRRSG